MKLERLTANSLAAGAILTLSACAGSGPGGSFAERDPYVETNRTFLDANIALDRNVLRPLAQGYDTVTPTLIQHLLGNAFDHLDTVNDFANYLLQGEVESAGVALGRFTVNTVLGIGVLDPATEFGLPKEDTDFGITLGKHGVEEGAYIVLPLLGPTTTRDLVGGVVDIGLSPQSYTGLFDAGVLNAVSPAYRVVNVVHDRNANADLVDDLLYNSDDPYVSLRTIYLQRRDAMISGEDTPDALPDIFDEDQPAATN